jgi:hypothetical protein
MAVYISATINSTLYRVSIGAQSETHYWDPFVKTIQETRREISQPWGGYCKIDWGSIDFSPELFESEWPPPLTIDIQIDHGETEAAKSTIFLGIGHLDTFDMRTVRYKLFEDAPDDLALSDAPDYDGETDRVYPLALGTVTYRKAMQKDSNTWHLGGIGGTKHTDWHVFDDGVDICSNATDNLDGTFDLSVAPVGTVTLSGTHDDIATLADLFDWGATALGLTLDTTKARSPSPSIGFWLDEQTQVLDVLRRASEACGHCFYTTSTSIYLIDMLTDNGTGTLTEFDYFTATYSALFPAAIFEVTRVVREAVNDGMGAHVLETEKPLRIASSYRYGRTIRVEEWSESQSDVKSWLGDTQDIYEKYQVTVSVPLSGSLPVPGKKYTVEDSNLITATTITFRVRSCSVDFFKEIVTLSGDGTIT